MIIVLCGLPASGKTTKAKQIKNQNSFVVLYCFDDLPNAHNPTFQSIIYDNIYSNILNDLTNNKFVIYDDLHITRKSRLNLLNAIKSIQCKKILLVMNTPYEICLQRNNSRDNKLPSYVIHHLNSKFESPSYDEGWDEIYYCYEKESEFL